MAKKRLSVLFSFFIAITLPFYALAEETCNHSELFGLEISNIKKVPSGILDDVFLVRIFDGF